MSVVYTCRVDTYKMSYIYNYVSGPFYYLLYLINMSSVVFTFHQIMGINFNSLDNHLNMTNYTTNKHLTY